jgi:hypothetical protein
MIPLAALLKVVVYVLLVCRNWVYKSHRTHGCLSLVSVACCQVEASVSGWSLVQRSLTECGVSKVELEATLCAARQWVQLPASEWAVRKLAMPFICANEKAGQLAHSDSVHHSVSQRWTEEYYCFITRYLTGHINYTEQVYNHDSILASK